VNSDGKLTPHTDPKHHDTTHFIRLKKNLYGCKQAARNWFQFLKQGILAQGFTQSAIDPCLFLRSDCIMVIYTDDCLIFAQEDSTIDQLIASLSKTYMLEDQGDVQDYLGIRITSDPATKTITMLQTGLIESIISDSVCPAIQRPLQLIVFFTQIPPILPARNFGITDLYWVN